MLIPFLTTNLRTKIRKLIAIDLSKIKLKFHGTATSLVARDLRAGGRKA